MRYILVAVLLAGMLLVTGLAQAAAPVPVPFKPGTAWVYQVQIKPVQGAPSVETRTITYRGETKFQGRSYHMFESRSSLGKGLERGLMIWTGTFFRQAVLVVVEGAKTTEIVFDKPYAATGVAEQLAGRTQVYVDGEPTGRGAWSSSVSRVGEVKVTVPAGTFTTARWTGAFILGNMKQVYTMYTVGPVEVRAEIDVFNKGQYQSSVVMELQKGVVGK